MARIAGITIPTEKKVKISLTYIYGIGLTSSLEILKLAKIDPEVKVKDLSEGELNRIRDIISNEYDVEGELQRKITANVKRLREVNSYRGLRHKLNLPVRGQRTKTNARTKRGRRATVGGIAIKAASKT